MNSLLWLVLSTTLICKSTSAKRWDHQPPYSKNTAIMPSKTVVGLNKRRYEEESYKDHVELKSLISNGSSNTAITWLSNKSSVVSHHHLDNSKMTLRGGAYEILSDIVSAESFDKKKSQSSGVISGFAKWYMHQMETHELRTKCISAGILGLVGDICAQEVGHYLTVADATTETGIIGMLHRLDKRRMLAMFSDGALTTGPLLHFVYAWYESILPIPEIDESSYTSSEEKRAAIRNRFRVALIHVLFDNFIMAILYVFLMMIITATLEGKYASIPYEMRHDFIPAIKASWKASVMGLAPMQLMSFHFLPVELRVLAVNVQDVIWVCVMSFVTHRNRH